MGFSTNYEIDKGKLQFLPYASKRKDVLCFPEA